MNVNKLIDDFEYTKFVDSKLVNIKMIYCERDDDKFIVMPWIHIKEKLKQMNVFGYTDWRLPTVDEADWILNIVYKNEIRLACWTDKEWCNDYAWIVHNGFSHEPISKNSYAVAIFVR